MEKNIHKYEFIQEGRKYILILEKNGDKTRLTCIEINVAKPNIFRGEFSLSFLKTLNPIFNNASNLDEAQKLIIKALEKQKIKIEYFGEYVNIKLYIINEDEKEKQYYDLKCDITKEPLYNKVIVLKTITKETSSPVRVLPRRYVNMPPTTDGKVKVSFSPVKRLPDKHIYLPPSVTISPTHYSSYKEEKYYYNEKTYETNNVKVKKLHLSLPSRHNLDKNNNSFHQNQSLNISPLTNNSYFQHNSSILEQKINYSVSPNYNYVQKINSNSSTNANTNFGQKNNYNFSPNNSFERNINYNMSSNHRTEQKINYNISPNQSLSPRREQIEYLNYGSPSKNKISYSTTFSSKYQEQNYSLLNPSLTEVKSDNSNKIIQLQNELNKIKEEYSLLKVENNKLINDNNGLLNENKILKEENNILRNNNKLNLNENNEIMILKKEIERLNKVIINLKDQKDNELNEYKKLKDEEIYLLKMQLNKSLNNKSLETNNISTIKTKNDYHLDNQLFNVQVMCLKVVKGEIIQNIEELEFLSKKICKNHKKVILNLIYKATVDSDRASAFHKKCDCVNSSLVLIKSGNNKRFGGYTSCNWKGDSIEKFDDNAFVFSLDKLKCYDIIPGENAIGCYTMYGPVFLGCQIRIYDQAFKNGGSTFQKGINYKTEEDYELTGGSRLFGVKEIEVYGIELQ